MKKTKLLSVFALRSFVNVAVKALFVLVIDVKVQNLTSTDEYGLYFSLQSLCTALTVLVDAGMTNYYNRLVAGRGNSALKLFPAFIKARIILLPFYATAVYFISLSCEISFYAAGLVLLLIFNNILLQSIQFLRACMSGLLMFDKETVVSITDKLLTVVMCTIIFAFPEGVFTVVKYAAIQTAGLLSAMILSVVFLRKKIAVRCDNKKTETVKKIFHKCLPYAVLTLVTGLYTRIDTLILNISGGSFQAGIYARSFRFFDAGCTFLLLGAGILLPVFAGNKKSENKSLIKICIPFLTVPCLILAISTLYFKELFISLFYSDLINITSTIFSIHMFALIPAAMSAVAGTFLTAEGKIALMIKISAVSLCFCLLGNVLFTNTYGAVATAWVCLVSYACAAILQIVFAFALIKKMRTEKNDSHLVV